MDNTLKYNGFTAKIEFSAHDNVFFGRLLNVDEIVVFDAETVEGLKQSMKESVDFYLEVCEKTGKKAKKGYSGKLLFRFDGVLHAKIAEAAAQRGKSVNEFGKQVFETAVKS